MTNTIKKFKRCIICGKEKPLSEFYKQHNYFKGRVKPTLKYNKKCKRCFIDKFRNPWVEKNKELQKIYRKNYYLKKTGKFDKIDKSEYKGRICERSHRIVNHLKREKNKKMINDFQTNARLLKNEDKAKIDAKYQEIVDILTPKN